MYSDNTWVTIDLDAISHNFQAIREKAGTDVMAIIKADAYGHGAIPIARLLQEKCSFFGVSSISEALELRSAGLTLPILVLGYTPAAAYETAIAQEIRPAIFHWKDALSLSQAASRMQKEAPFHFALDTGMSRIGFQVTPEDADLCKKIADLPWLKAEGLFSHFATADCADLSRADAQAARFAEFDAMLRQRGLSVPLRHLYNSAGIMNYPPKYELVRSGIVTYGMYPSDEVSPQLLPLIPVLQWFSRVSHVKTLPAGRQIGYGGTYTTDKDTVVATIPVGYADGYRRSLSGKFYVLIRGQKAPILGRVCMDQMMVDVTHIPGVQYGDPVTLIGKDGAEVIPIEAIAQEAGSFNYEFACGISRRVPRYYIRNGEIIHAVHYLLD